ncbi:MAG: RagB/SusD family nutrient uptake outer membrane protein, partial [Bacteroidales bacterium]|nr:RagB/SusD family nutrient uptake outer membrane protein [Bacteroidales bacterium]
NGGWGEVLNFPYKSGESPGGCCGFFQPTQDFVNSFRTSGGLPLLDGSLNNPAEEIRRDQGIPTGSVWKDDNGDVWKNTDKYLKGNVVTMYDPAEPFLDRAYESLTGTAPPDDPDAPNVGNNPLTSPADWKFLWVEDNSEEVDPRLDWSVGRRGIPYWDWDIHTGSDWIRDQTYSGPYSPKKQVYKQSQEGTYTEVGNWTSGYTANGYRTIRYADALLLKAECEAMTNSGDRGMGEVNAIRARAANTDGFVKEADGVTYAANYVIGLYPASQFASTASAMLAIKFERKLELGQEGHRYYDLQRWGDVVSNLSRIMVYEKTMIWGSALYGDATIGPEDVNFPIPQRQIDVSNANLVQNR